MKGMLKLMKKVLLKILKKYRLTTFLTVFFIMLNIYFLTYPPKIIGNIVDLLYNIEQNKQQIIRTNYLLVRNMHSVIVSKDAMEMACRICS